MGKNFWGAQRRNVFTNVKPMETIQRVIIIKPPAGSIFASIISAGREFAS